MGNDYVSLSRKLGLLYNYFTIAKIYGGLSGQANQRNRCHVLLALRATNCNNFDCYGTCRYATSELKI